MTTSGQSSIGSIIEQPHQHLGRGPAAGIERWANGANFKNNKIHALHDVLMYSTFVQPSERWASDTNYNLIVFSFYKFDFFSFFFFSLAGKAKRRRHWFIWGKRAGQLMSNIYICMYITESALELAQLPNLLRANDSVWDPPTRWPSQKVSCH